MTLITVPKNNKRFIIELSFFLTYFIIGIVIFKDYGISWDENISRLDCGKVNLDFILGHSDLLILSSTEKYHGPFFEVILYYFERVFQLHDLRDVFLLRHFCTFFVFFLSTIYLYKIFNKLTCDFNISLLSITIFIFTPRIFADSFYNSKDLVFLAFFIFTIYTSFQWFEKRNLKSLIIHALLCAMCTSVRITGIFIIAISLLFYILPLLRNINSGRKLKTAILETSTFVTLTFSFTVLFWPVLWLGPIKHLILAFREMSSFHWNGVVLFKGSWIHSEKLPWDYIPVWIGITTPLFYLILFAIGIFSIVFKTFKSPLKLTSYDYDKLFILACFFGPILSVIILNSVVYDGWRHLYFIYPPMAIIIAYGLKSLYSILSQKVDDFKSSIIISTIVILMVIPIGIFMIRYHPYQNLFFNSLVSKDVNVLRRTFELDYWGLTYKEALENILKSDKSKNIKIKTQHYPGEINSFILSKADRKRIIYVNTREEANYYINNYRDFTEASQESKFYVVKRDGKEYCYVLKLNN